MAPRAASARAVASPSPLAPPVMIAGVSAPICIVVPPVQLTGLAGAVNRAKGAGGGIAENRHARLAIVPVVGGDEARRGGGRLVERQLQHDDGAGCDPAAVAGRGQRGGAQAGPVGRVGEDKVVGRAAAGAEAGRVAPPDLGLAGQPQPLDVLADQRPRGRVILDEDGEDGAP